MTSARTNDGLNMARYYCNSHAEGPRRAAEVAPRRHPRR